MDSLRLISQKQDSRGQGVRDMEENHSTPSILEPLASSDYSYTLFEQESRMPRIQGVKGEAVVNYAEPLTTL
jgi:hypothetical protein